MNRRSWGAVAVVVAVAAGLWWWSSQRTDEAASTIQPAPGPGVTARPTVRGTEPDAPATQVATTKTALANTLPEWFAQPGAPARRVAGHVTFEGMPVADALVRLLPAQGLQGQVGRDVRTSADGAFDFGLAPAMPHSVSASAAGRTDALVDVDLRDPTAQPAPDALELVLSGCDARLEGHVYDSGGGPIERARVFRQGTAGALTNAKGEYELCLPRGQNPLLVDADGYGRQKLSALVLGHTTRDFRLFPEAFIVGRVVMAADGTPAPGALVSAWPNQFTMAEGPAGGTVLAAADGRFRVSVTPGEYRVSAQTANASTPNFARVTAIVGRLSDEVTLRLHTAPTLRGHVLRAGKPVPGATVAAILGTGSGHREAISQADGSFVMPRAPVGELTFTAAPFAVLAPKKFTMPKVDATVELEVKNQAVLRGLVTARGGKPVEGAAIDVGTGMKGVQAVSGPDGRYVAAGLAAGTWTVVATSERVGGFVEVKGVKLADGEEKTLDLSLDSAATISGRVVSEAGEPVVGALVVYLHTRTGDMGRSVTDAQGHFQCDQMTGGGDYLPKVYPSTTSRTPYAPAGAAFTAVKLADGSSQVEGVTLAVKYERLSIRGRVVDPSGAPVPDARVRAMGVVEGEPVQFSPWADLLTAAADAQGAFVLEPLTSGTWALQVRTPEGGEAVAPAVVAGSKDVVITVHPPAIVEGTLVGFEVPPVVYAGAPDEQGFVAGTVEGNTFKVSVGAGTWVVTAMNTREGDAQRVTLKEGTTTHLVLTSHGHGVLEGTAIDHVTRAPMPDLTCHVVLAAGGTAGITNWDTETAPHTDASGHFTADPSPAGDLHVSCFGDYSAVSPGVATLTLAKGGHGEVTVEVVRRAQDSTGEVGLTLADEAGRVLSVRAGSPAAKAGVVAGDVVAAVDGLPIGPLSGDGVLTLVANHPVGTVVKLTVSHGAQARELALTTVGRGQ